MRWQMTIDTPETTLTYRNFRFEQSRDELERGERINRGG